jgi:hypothetical protein
VIVASRDSWFWGAGILDPTTGKIQKIPLKYDADIGYLAWNRKNKLVAAAQLFHSSIWRFRPESGR